MHTDLQASLRTHFGFDRFLPGQYQAIQYLLNHQDTLVVMPTGSGKSLVYQLAALNLPGLTLVISPLIALMKDQVDGLNQHKIAATYINSSLPVGEQNRRLKEMAAGKYRIIYLAPERLRNITFLEELKRLQVSLLAVDEAHCLSHWGHDFRPDYLHIAQFREALGNPTTVGLTATATPQVQDEIGRLLGVPDMQRVVTGFNRPNLAFEVRYTANLGAKYAALHELLEEKPSGGTIIYVGTRRDAEEVAEFARTVLGIDACHYHAGMQSEERTQIQDAFMGGTLSLVVATNAFGMGIDRPDVRQVIHYFIPGSLEAYYQEAGRAGRDGQPARAVLLYLPDDRSLQEWLITQSLLSAKDIRGLYAVLQSPGNARHSLTLERLSLQTGQGETKVRIGLAELERAGMVQNLGEEGLSFRVKVREWDESRLDDILRNNEQHQEHRRRQLEKMLVYAESNACRRKIILGHFGDPGPLTADKCCDNCQIQQEQPARAPNPLEQLTQLERAALIVLDTVKRLARDVGRVKLEQILKGSKANDILQFGYTHNTYYGRLNILSKDDILGIIDELVEQGYLKVIGGKYPVLRLTPKGDGALHARAAISLKRVHRLSTPEMKRRKAEKQAGNTIEFTAQLIRSGLTVEQVANERGLKASTIYQHASLLIASGNIPVERVVPEDVRRMIEVAISQAGAVDPLYPIKILLPEEIEYNVIRCVVEDWKLKRSEIPKNNAEGEVTGAPPDDPIAAYLARSHPRKLPGPWRIGWALEFHSQFSGGEWKRSRTGELAYRLKYQGDRSVLPGLIDQALELGANHPELFQVDAVIPVPPSVQRSNDPVSSFASLLAKRMGLRYLPALKKVKETVQQKELQTSASKRNNVAGAFAITAQIKSQRLLVVDDLFDSGATLEETYRVLRSAGAAEVFVFTITRSIHSDA